MARPVRLELRPIGDQHQDPGIADLAQRLRHQLPACWVDPVRVLEDVKHRLFRGEAEELIDQSLQCAFAALLGGQLERTVALGGRQ